MKPEALGAKLPLIIGWFDKTLAEHAAQARPVASLGFKGLPKFFSPALLARAKVVPVPEVPVPPLTKMGLPEFADFENMIAFGITYQATYFVQAGLLADESLHFHELVHIVQWERLGVEKFLLAYAAGLAVQGYRNSPLERMAFDWQRYFDENGPPVDVELSIRMKLNSSAENWKH